MRFFHGIFRLDILSVDYGNLHIPRKLPVGQRYGGFQGVGFTLVHHVDHQLLAGFIQRSSDIEGADTAVRAVLVGAGEGIAVPEDI